MVGAGGVSQKRQIAVQVLLICSEKTPLTAISLN
jgi:hypothetical protein